MQGARPFGSALLVAALATLVLAGHARAAPAVNGVFDLSGAPGELAAGPDGNVWATLSGSGAGKTLARIAPDGTVTEYAPGDVTNPVGIAGGPDGNVWLTQAGAVVKVPPANPDGAVKFAVAAITDPRGITAGPDGNLWAASGDQLVKIPPANPTGFEQFTVAGMGARGIASGGGRLWIADFGSARIVSATTAGVPTPVDVGGGPQQVAAGPGDQAAYTNPGDVPQTVGRLQPGGPAQTTQTPLSDPFGITRGADGAYWIAQFAAGNLGRLTPAGAYTTLGGLPAGSGPRYLAAAPGGTLWVGLETSHQVARVSGVEAPSPAKPDTVLTKKPKNRVKAKRRGAKVRYRFRSEPAGADFECALRRKGKRTKREKRLARFRACSSPKRYRHLRRGRYRFAVRAVAAAGTDPSPARDRFRVKG